MFKNAVCYMLQVGVLDIKSTDSNLLISELNSTVATNVVSLKLSKRTHQKAFDMSFLHKQITHLQSAFGVENKSMAAFENIVRYLLKYLSNWKATKSLILPLSAHRSSP